MTVLSFIDYCLKKNNDHIHLSCIYIPSNVPKSPRFSPANSRRLEKTEESEWDEADELAEHHTHIWDIVKLMMRARTSDFQCRVPLRKLWLTWDWLLTQVFDYAQSKAQQVERKKKELTYSEEDRKVLALPTCKQRLNKTKHFLMHLSLDEKLTSQKVQTESGIGQQGETLPQNNSSNEDDCRGCRELWVSGSRASGRKQISADRTAN